VEGDETMWSLSAYSGLRGYTSIFGDDVGHGAEAEGVQRAFMGRLSSQSRLSSHEVPLETS
jgi:hypothetical protein